MIERIKLAGRKFSEAFIACGLTMVQGDITVLSIGHVKVASQVGVLTALAIFVTSFFVLSEKNKELLFLYLTGLFTMLADYIVHPGTLGPQWMEAVVTGLGAVFIALFFNKFIAKNP
jgi:divalent metal cation (Fe/Co/Zn/Cd) transporter